jgi:hypothetical protein
METVVRLERIKGGFAAYSAEWRLAAAGRTEREALTRLEDVLLLFHRLAERASRARSTKLENPRASNDDRLRSDGAGM